MSDEPNETHIDNFSHSGKAELYPEFVVCDMGSLREWWLYAVLDAYSCAAAGQKLTLDKGLGREKLPIKKKGRNRLLPF